MEDTVWIFFGVLVFLFTIGIVTNLVLDSRVTVQQDRLDVSVKILQSQCNYVCNSPLDTLLSIDVELPSGVILRGGVDDADKICLEWKEDLSCGLCNCNIERYELSLNTTLAKKSFDGHPYGCSFLRGENAISMACQG
jgi:hypothetical protein